ncbi:hypothetical protein CHS0354_008145 [Potamilus streckersoni]|uniref:Peptidase S1 domain-containing protein n=1 Tax=Potamilus streckersoni TaxID=2493646 RepID=A0AAE0SIK9_9BIVA|nr:hypothetical protein CHS0354_008145 [Potamilus streckersoni]
MGLLLHRLMFTSVEYYQGDSGGPLVCRNKHGRFQLLGITSFVSHGGCTMEAPAGYQLVHPYLDWIRYVTGLSFTDPESND